MTASSEIETVVGPVEPVTIAFGGEERPAILVDDLTRRYEEYVPGRIHRAFRVFRGAALDNGGSAQDFDDEDDDDLIDDDYDDEMLERRARTRVPLVGVSLHLSGHGCVGIVGPPRSGKSVLLRTIAGLTAPTTGQVVVYGVVAPWLPNLVKLMPKRGTVARAIIPFCSALRLPPREIKRRLPEVAEALGEPGVLKKQIGAVQRGPRAQLILGAMLAVAPDVVLLDAALPGGAFGQQMLERLTELKRTSSLVVVAGRNVESVSFLADHVVFMDAGRIVGDAPIAEALEREQAAASLASE